MRRAFHFLTALVLLSCGCTGQATFTAGGSGGGIDGAGGLGGPGGPVNDPAKGPNGEVVGSSASGETYIISDHWDPASVVGGNNVKFLSWAQMQNEVTRATGVNWANWAGNQTTFGGADYQSTFVDQRLWSGTKLTIWREMASDVCTQMIANEQSAPKIFTSVNPTASISVSDPKVAQQVGQLFTHFFLEGPNGPAVDDSVSTLGALVQAGSTPSGAWAGLCVAYITSMRFISY